MGTQRRTTRWDERGESDRRVGRRYRFDVVELSKARAFGWARAVVEMFLDPVLVRWVPEPVLEQYRRWNHYFVPAVEKILSEAGNETITNQSLCKQVHRLMTSVQERQRDQGAAAAQKKPMDHAGSDESSSGGEDVGDAGSEGERLAEEVDEERQAEDETRNAVVKATLPGFGADDPDAGAAERGREAQRCAACCRTA